MVATPFADIEPDAAPEFTRATELIPADCRVVVVGTDIVATEDMTLISLVSATLLVLVLVFLLELATAADEVV